jgi:streptomycin 6-kinase
MEGAPVRSPSGCVAFGHITGPSGGLRHVAVKVTREGSDEGLAWAALRHFAGEGCVRLLDVAHGAHGASLLERVVPGTRLGERLRAGGDDEATAILCDIAGSLHRHDAPPADAGFPTVEDWGRAFARYRRSGDTALPPTLVARAAAVFAEMAASQDAPRLLHGDLHHENVLLDAGRGWLAIDPKGVLGEPSYEFGALLRNPWGEGVVPAFCASPSVVDRAAASSQSGSGWIPSACSPGASRRPCCPRSGAARTARRPTTRSRSLARPRT